jgi:general secretion pathway protein G
METAGRSCPPIISKTRPPTSGSFERPSTKRVETLVMQPITETQFGHFRTQLKSRNMNAGFTLLEIMLVVMIIALLAGSAIYLMRKNVFIAQEEGRVRPDIQTIMTQLQMYESFNGVLPSTEQGLQALVTAPSGDPQPRHWRNLMPSVPTDPWGSPYQYRCPATKSSEGYDLFSLGKDRTANTADDIGNW